MTPKEFVTKYLPYAIEVQRETGLSAVFILAQTALESEWSKSAPGNNFGGIKAKKNTPEGQKQLLLTTEVSTSPNLSFPKIVSKTPQVINGKKRYVYRVYDWFRKYDTPADFFRDHSKFFFENKRYSEALKVKADPIAFARAVAAAGYATDPNYAKTLVSVITTIKKNLP